jgi:hypothetical protein
MGPALERNVVRKADPGGIPADFADWTPAGASSNAQQLKAHRTRLGQSSFGTETVAERGRPGEPWSSP